MIRGPKGVLEDSCFAGTVAYPVLYISSHISDPTRLGINWPVARSAMLPNKYFMSVAVPQALYKDIPITHFNCHRGLWDSEYLHSL